MSIARKFALIGAAGLLPFTLATWLLFHELYAGIRLISVERRALDYHVALERASRAFQDYRDRVYSGQAPDGYAAKMDSALAALRQANERSGAQLATSSQAQRVSQQWRLMRTPEDAAGGDTFWYNQAVPLQTEFLALQWRLGEMGGLERDSDPQARQYAALVATALPTLRQRVAALRGLGSAAFRAGGLRAKARNELARLAALVETDLEGLTGKEQALTLAGAAATKEISKPLRDLEFEVGLFLEQARELLSAVPRRFDAASYFQSASECLSTLDTLYEVMVPLLDARLAERNAALQRRLAVLMAADAALLLAAALLAFVTLRSVLRSIGEALQIADQVADGDLTRIVAGGAADETGRMMEALARMNAGLSRIALGVREAAGAVTNAAGQLASGNSDLGRRTEAQASAIEQTAASLEELAASVQTNAQGASEARRLTASAERSVEAGSASVNRVAASMREIESSSRRVGEIAAIIDSIAFQTNLLALNAAVEAARAGERGKGFGVVAGEVRALAQRCSASARDIRAVLAESATKIRAGVESVGETCERMTGIASEVREIDAIVQSVARASSEQAHGLGQVSQAVSQLEGVTQQNAALVEQVMAAIQSLVDQSAGLSRVVQVFRLPATDGPGTSIVLS